MGYSAKDAALEVVKHWFLVYNAVCPRICKVDWDPAWDELSADDLSDLGYEFCEMYETCNRNGTR